MKRYFINNLMKGGIGKKRKKIIRKKKRMKNGNVKIKIMNKNAVSEEEKLRFIWLDDDPSREKSSINLRSELNVDMKFVSLNKRDINKELLEVIKLGEPNLVIMDHSLDKGYSETIKTGSSAAAILRDKWPKCPIISLTAAPIRRLDNRQRSAYEEMFSIKEISNNYDAILAMSKGFAKLRANEPKDVHALLSFFEPPEDDVDKIIEILPKELKENFEDDSLTLELYRWADTILFSRPGFLYDRLWSATLLGLSEKGFKTIEDKFIDAKYTGIFRNDTNELWWKSELLEILGNLIEEVNLPWIIGRKLVDDKEEYYSKCHYSGESYPDLVAFEDDTETAERFQMKLQYTEAHPYYENMLFFKELRKMKSTK